MNRLLSRFKLEGNEKGSVIVIVAISMVILLGMTALVVDVGAMAAKKNKLQAAADAAALAGAQELPNTSDASAKASEYLNRNLGSGYSESISFSESNQKISVNVTDNVLFSFAPVIGVNDSDVTAHAAAINAPVISVGSGLRPFGLVPPSGGFEYGTSIILKHSSQTKKAPEGDTLGSGNFGIVNLWTSDPHYKYEDTVISGAKEKYKIGSVVDTYTGNTAGPTADGVRQLLEDNGGQPVPILVPLFSSLYVNGNKPVTIIGFSVFVVEGISEKGNNVEVTGRFEKTLTPEEADLGATDYGVRAVNLVE